MSARFSFLDHLACPSCGWTGDPREPYGLCPTCAKPLLTRYDLVALREALPRAALAARPETMWRYHELLPVREPGNVVSLGEPMTQLLPLPRLGRELGLTGLLVKDEGLLPTGSFKARGAATGVSRALELGYHRVAMPTNGNAGAAWAQYGARAGIETLIAMPASAPEITRRECAVAGAELFLVDGLIGDAGRMVAEAVAGGDWFDVATLKEPYRLDGKKAMGLELVEQLGWALPDVVVFPTGGGVGLIGIHKAMLELGELGWVEGPMPRFVVVQAAGCAPVVEAFERGARACEAWPDASTIAFGINVPKPLGDALVLDVLYETDGCALAVTDAELLDDLAHCARTEGLFLCPEGAATISAVRSLRERGWLDGGERVVVLNTGAGIKYPESVAVDAPRVAADGSLPRGARRRAHRRRPDREWGREGQ